MPTPVPCLPPPTRPHLQVNPHPWRLSREAEAACVDTTVAALATLSIALSYLMDNRPMAAQPMADLLEEQVCRLTKRLASEHSAYELATAAEGGAA
ncbi:MAG TPA: hypothetical protein PKN23_09640 [Candidatus Hydrogenedentes bacterium]|nr:hypothetical protein [Candidatus Hydrogenedentota bacterium]HOH51290.1 hypothetical protein [Candidatus Hydrogenedentota bacterium]